VETPGVRVLKAKGHGLKLEVDTAQTPLEPIIAAIMQHSHILDMTIADPPMEEIIAAIYSEKGKVETGHSKQEQIAQEAEKIEEVTP